VKQCSPAARTIRRKGSAQWPLRSGMTAQTTKPRAARKCTCQARYKFYLRVKTFQETIGVTLPLALSRLFSLPVWASQFWLFLPPLASQLEVSQPQISAVQLWVAQLEVLFVAP
jgi:hypothetical protein